MSKKRNFKGRKRVFGDVTVEAPRSEFFLELPLLYKRVSTATYCIKLAA